MMQRSLDITVARQVLVNLKPPLAPFLDWLDGVMGRGDSVLEDWFLYLFAYFWADCWSVTYRGQCPPHIDHVRSKTTVVDVDRQVKLGRYRCDFIFSLRSTLNGRSRRVALECDGHRFHDRTPQQASSDRERDRALLRDGLATIRFTFNDLAYDPDNSMRDFTKTLLALGHELNVREDA